MAAITHFLGYVLGYLIGAAALRLLTFNRCRARSWDNEHFTLHQGPYFDRDYDGRIVVHEDLVAVFGVILTALAAILAGRLGLQFLR